MHLLNTFDEDTHTLEIAPGVDGGLSPVEPGALLLVEDEGKPTPGALTVFYRVEADGGLTRCVLLYQYETGSDWYASTADPTRDTVSLSKSDWAHACPVTRTWKRTDMDAESYALAVLYCNNVSVAGLSVEPPAPEPYAFPTLIEGGAST